MKKYFISIGKALCYFALFLLGQFVVTYAYMSFELTRLFMADPELASGDIMEGFWKIYPEAVEKTLAATDALYIFMFALTVGILLLVFHMRGKNIFRETWMRPFKLGSVWAIPLAAVCASLVTFFIITYLPWPESAIEEYVEMSEVPVGSGVLSLISTCLLAPILEEIIFRGLVFTRLCRGMSASSAIFLSALLFASVHGTLIWMVYAFICAVIMLLIYMKYRSLYASMLFHIVFNLFGGFLQPVLFANTTVKTDLIAVAAASVIGIGLAYVLYTMPRSKIDLPDRLPPR